MAEQGTAGSIAGQGTPGSIAGQGANVDTRPAGEYDTPWDVAPNPNILRMKDSVRKRVEEATGTNRQRSSYFRLLTSIASDLEVMLNDLCQQFPYASSPLPSCLPCDGTRLVRPKPYREASEFEQYMTSAGALDNDESFEALSSDSDMFADRSESTTSSDVEFFSFEEDQTSDAAVAGTDLDSPPPVPPPPHPACLGGSLLGRNVPLLERLIRTHPVWYLPNIGRAGAVHLLHNRSPGAFIVRQASRKDTMALSVRLAEAHSSEHYLVESTPKGLKLEGSDNFFPAIPVLVAHYCDCRDELPVQLALPEAIMKAKSHQELTSLALLGQDFWTSPISQEQSSKPVIRTVYHTTVNGPTSGTATASQSGPKTSSFSTTNKCVNGATSTTATSSSIPHSSVHSVKSTLSSTQVTRTMDTFQKVCATKTVTKTTQINGAIPNSTSSLKTTKGSEASSYVNGALSSSLSSIPDPKPKLAITSSREAPVTNGAGLNPSETSAFSCPSATKAVVAQAAINKSYHKSRLPEKLSDYEDAVWNGGAPTSGGSDVRTPFFRPIQNGSVTEDETVSLVSDTDGQSGFSMVNPGYHSDTASDKSEFVFHPGHKLPAGRARKDVETERVEETQTVNVERIVPAGVRAKDEPVTFTFDLPTQTVNSLSQSGSLGRSRHTPPTTRAPAVPEARRPSQEALQPTYAQPWAPVVSKVDTKTDTTSSAINVSDYFIEKKQEAPRFPPEIPPRKESFHFRDFTPKMTSFLPSSSAHQSQANNKEPLRSNASITLKSASSTPKLSPTHTNKKTATDSPKICTIGRSQSMKALAEELEKPISARAQSLPKEVPDQPLGSSSTTTTHSSRVVKNSSTLVQVTTVRVPVTVPEEGIVSSQARPAVFSTTNSLNHRRNKPPTAPKPQTPSSPEKAFPPPVQTHTQRPPPISQSFEENFFKPEAIKRLEQPAKPHINKFPVYNSQSSLASFSDTSTVEDMISDVSPDLTMKPIKPLTIKNLQRISEYDNINHRLPGAPSSRRTVVSSAGTQYCQPWDSNLWDNLMSMPHPPKHAQTPSDYQDAKSEASDPGSEGDYSSVYYESESGRAPSMGSEVCTSTFEWSKEGKGSSVGESSLPRVSEQTEVDIERSMEQITAEAVSDDEGVEDDHDATQENFSKRLMPLLSTPRIIGMRNRGSQCPGVQVRDFVHGLAQKNKTTFGIMVEEFIKCTVEGSESNPHTVVANVRQFMNGIKNYLVQHGEDELNQIIEAERVKLGPDEFLNIDAIIEGALHKCVVKPLKQHIYKLFVNEYKRNGNLQLLSDNIKYARTKSPTELGVKPGILPPQGASMEVIKHFITKMQKAYSPLKKLENLLGATSSIYNSIQSTPVPETSTSSSGTITPGADDFLPMFIYVLAQCGVVAAEIEADYMWGLLHPCLLTGEGAYHLTTLSSAVHVLKNLRDTMETTFDPETDSSRLPCIGDLQGFMKIVIPNETNDSIITKTLPVRPNMTTRDVCSMIAHKFRITNPQDYGLYVLVAGIEDKMTENACPQAVKRDLIINGQECVFAYKRNHAKFAWPKSFK